MENKRQSALTASNNAWNAITNPDSEHFHKIKSRYLDTLHRIAFKTHENEMFGKYPLNKWLELTYRDRVTFYRHTAELEKVGLIELEKFESIWKITVIDKFAPVDPNTGNVINFNDRLKEMESDRKSESSEYVPNPDWSSEVQERNIFYRELIRNYPSLRKREIPDDKDISITFPKYLLDKFDVEKYKAKNQDKEIMKAGIELRNYLREKMNQSPPVDNLQKKILAK